MNEIRYETPIEKVDTKLPTVFLAGPTVRGHQPHLTSWRFEAARLFAIKGFKGNLIIPEFTDKTESDKYRYDVPVWEFKGLTISQVNMFWIPRTKELIGLTTNHEHGYWLARNPYKVIYGRPDDAYRVTYLDIMWVEEHKRRGVQVAPIYNTLEKTVDAAMQAFPDYNSQIAELFNKEEKAQLPISSCCNSTATCKENRKWVDGVLKCVGTYYSCDKCGLACEYEWKDQ